MKTPHKAFMVMSRHLHHVLQTFFRITDEGDYRITDDNNPRITDDSDY